MKTLQPTLILLTLAFAWITAGCGKTDDTREPSETDKATFERMEAAYKAAIQYNDSLRWCINHSDTCPHEYLFHCDSIFHSFIHQWEYHHERYSHNTSGDDHYHRGGMTNHHDRRKGDSHQQGHGFYQHELMTDLMAGHEHLHPAP